ncbi:MAG: ATP-binding protein [Cytophagales bacterium]|nr:ATP-binding protein [Cytophagales bacterium]
MGFRIIRLTNKEVLENWKSVDERLSSALAELSPDPSLKKRGERIPKEFRGELEKGKVLRIVLLGPESTGKTVITEQLAEHFNTAWVSEHARQYIEGLNRPYGEADLLEIAKGQIQHEDEKAQSTKGFLFCDTNLITIKIWSDFKYSRTDPWIMESVKTRRYDFYLLMDIDLPWEPDPLREHPEQRQDIFDLYKEHLDTKWLPYSIIKGEGKRRIQNAIEAIESFTLSKI